MKRVPCSDSGLMTRDVGKTVVFHVTIDDREELRLSSAHWRQWEAELAIASCVSLPNLNEGGRFDQTRKLQAPIYGSRLSFAGDWA